MEKIYTTNNNKNANYNSGITLIALVISIIVMLILAGISLNATVGENGIITKASNAKLAYEEAEWYEMIQTVLVDAYARLDTETNMQEWLKNQLQNLNPDDLVCVTQYKDGYLIVAGKRAITVDKNMNITSSRENTFLISTGDDWYFETNGIGTCKLTAYKLNLAGTITIPSMVTDKDTGNVYMVTELANDIFNYATRVTKINLSGAQNLEKIGARAFSNCSNLEINLPEDLPNSVVNIGDKAFYNCTKLNGNINTIINKGYDLGKGVFMKCQNLTGEIQYIFDQNIYIDDNGNPVATIIEENQFSGYSGLVGSLTIPKYITSIGNYAFYDCSGISSLEFENESLCTSIGDYAFYNNSGITGTVTIPNSVISIGTETFRYCSNMTGIVLSQNLEKIGREAIRDCNKISNEIIIPKTLEILSAGVFAEDAAITSVIFQSDGNMGCKEIESSAFVHTRVNNVVLPKTLKILSGFPGCHSLNTISIPSSVEIINSSAFFLDNNLKNVIWETDEEGKASLILINQNAFHGCSSLIELPDISKLTSLNVLGEEAFSSCTNLGKVGDSGKSNIIDYLKSSNIGEIGNNCFAGDTYLEGTIIGEVRNSIGIINLGTSVFLSTSVTKGANIPTNGVYEITAYEYSGVTNFVNEDNEEVTELIIPETVTSIGIGAFSGCTSVTKITIPSSVTTIGKEAFKSCKNLKELIFENSDQSKLTQISEYMCAYTNIEEIIIPKNVVEINSSAFYSCKNLKNVTLQEGINKIQAYAFWNCEKLVNIEFPDSLSYINHYAFANCYSLMSVTLPDTISYLGTGVFMNDTDLEEVIYSVSNSVIYPTQFQNCTSLKKITFKTNITQIRGGAFLDCTSLNSIIGLNWENIAIIEDSAFKNCTSLTGDVLLNPKCSVAESAFNNCNLSVSK